MKADFWHRKWRDGEIGFHQAQPNPLLVDYFDHLGITEGGRVFVPLCGKSLDLPWLMAHGYEVVGVELSELAVKELFEGLGVEPEKTQIGNLILYGAPHIEVYVGDLFDLSASQLGRIDAVYDRAAIVALPPGMRPRYAATVTQLTATAPQLLISFEYDQSQMPGPPFAVPTDELKAIYGGDYQLNLLRKRPVPGGLKGKVQALEMAWALTVPQT